jgi:uncharacterized protein
MSFLTNIRKRLRQRHKPSPIITDLLKQVRQVMQGAQALNQYVLEPSRERALRVRAIEKRADKVRYDLVRRLNNTFVTPIDREDLFSLSRAIDDILDYMYSTTREMVLLDVEPDHHLTKMVVLLYQSARELYCAIEHLEHHPRQAEKHALRVLTLENRMDVLYARTLAEMFQQVDSPTDIVHMLKLREIHRHLYHAADSAKQAANLIHDIIIKFY